MQLMLTQPPIDISSNAEVRVSFDPPVIGLGEKATYRVAINAVSDSIKWRTTSLRRWNSRCDPARAGRYSKGSADKISWPLTVINHHVTATASGDVHRSRVQGESMGATSRCGGEGKCGRVLILRPRPRRVYLELAETNAYCGQPVTVRVLIPATRGNAIQVLSQVQINGDGVLVDQGFGAPTHHLWRSTAHGAWRMQARR